MLFDPNHSLLPTTSTDQPDPPPVAPAGHILVREFRTSPVLPRVKLKRELFWRLGQDGGVDLIALANELRVPKCVIMDTNEDTDVITEEALAPLIVQGFLAVTDVHTPREVARGNHLADVLIIGCLMFTSLLILLKWPSSNSSESARE